MWRQPFEQRQAAVALVRAPMQHARKPEPALRALQPLAPSAHPAPHVLTLAYCVAQTFS